MPKNRNFQPVEPLPGWAIYLRTSSKDAQNPKTSKERQRRNIQRALIDTHDMPVFEVYSDTETGTNPNRANYQRMLRDARQGHFSHVAVENADRFGRDDAEALRAINELERLGVTLRFADYPDIDPTRPDERLVVTVMLSMAQRESKKLGERVRGGQLTKLLNGGHLGRAPDGYVNRREKVTGGPREQSGRTYSWVEVDPERSEIWRYAWYLLLKDQYTLKEICEKLHERGYTLRSGRHFVVPPERGKRTHATNTLSHIFHNWFYAGYVVNDHYGILPKTVEGLWEPLVTLEEFERGLAILDKRWKKRSPRRKHFYLLKKIAYVAIDDEVCRLSGSTPNTRRDTGGNRYYCLPGSGINIPCEIVDAQIAEALESVWIPDDHVGHLRTMYMEEVELVHADPGREIQHLERLLEELDRKEERMLRVFSAGKITMEQWENVWNELQEQRRVHRHQINLMEQHRESVIANLDDALSILQQLSRLYGTLLPDRQRMVLQEIIEKVVVDVNGKILWLELHPPFAYLANKYGEVKKRLAISENKSAIPIRGGTKCNFCSEQVLEVDPGRTRTYNQRIKSPMLCH